MKLSTKVTELSRVITPAVDVCDVTLWGLEFLPQGKQSLLRIYIEVSPEEKMQGKHITIENCAAVNHQVSGVLEVHDPIAGEYILEVSSPGVDRPFFYIEQLHDYVNQVINLRLIHAIDSKSGKRRKISGKMVAIDEKQLTLISDNEELSIAFNNIDKANLIYQ